MQLLHIIENVPIQIYRYDYCKWFVQDKMKYMLVIPITGIYTLNYNYCIHIKHKVHRYYIRFAPLLEFWFPHSWSTETEDTGGKHQQICYKRSSAEGVPRHQLHLQWLHYQMDSGSWNRRWFLTIIRAPDMEEEWSWQLHQSGLYSANSTVSNQQFICVWVCSFFTIGREIYTGSGPEREQQCSTILPVVHWASESQTVQSCEFTYEQSHNSTAGHWRVWLSSSDSIEISEPYSLHCSKQIKSTKVLMPRWWCL